jgi:hypothetical protein
MATAEYYRKQTELLLVWAFATTDPSFKTRLIERAFDFLAKANCADDESCACFKWRCNRWDLIAR